MESSMENSALSASAHACASTYTAVISAKHGTEHAQRQKLFELFEACVLTDVVLVVQEQPIAAHRVVLATASPFFHALFTSGMKDSCEPRVVLHGIDASAFRALLAYMYIGQLHITGDSILAILHTANQLEMADVVELCCKQLMLELSVYNCVDIYLCCDSLAMRPACQVLATAARAMLETYGSDVYRTDAFKNLPLGSVVALLRRRKQRLVDDDAAVQSWLMHDPLARTGELSRAFRSFHSTEHNETGSMANTLSAISTSGMINSRVRLHDSPLLSPTLSPTQNQTQLTPTIFAIGGFNGPSALETVERLDFHTNEWFPVASMNAKRSYSGVVVVDTPTHHSHQIVVVGGTSNARHLKSVEQFDPERNRWTLLPPMRRARSYLGAVYVNNSIFAVGGFNGSAHLSSVERLDLTTNEWTDVAPLQVGRSGLAVVVLNNQIFAIGGYDGRKHLKSVEVLDVGVANAHWRFAPSMRFARNGPAAVAQTTTQRIVVYGGESRHGIRMDTSERLDLGRANVLPTTGEWCDVDAFVDARSGHVAFSFLADSFLFCLGGSNKKDEYLDSVHRYDHLTKTWRLHSHMRSQRCGLNVAVVPTTATAACLDVTTQRKQPTDRSDGALVELAATATATALELRLLPSRALQSTHSA